MEKKDRAKVTIDLVEIKKHIRVGLFEVYILRNGVFIKDTENGETIMICDLDEVEERQNFEKVK